MAPEYPLDVTWASAKQIARRSYRCGFCGDRVGSQTGFSSDSKNDQQGLVYICPTCNQPTYFTNHEDQTPGVSYGNEVPNVTNPDVLTLYYEARRCMSVEAFTAAVMVCRKLVLNVAHDASGQSFANFSKAIDWLVSSEYLPKKSKDAFDQIRQVGNEANHEIPLMERRDAESMIELSEQLLRLVYQFPGIPAPAGGSVQTTPPT